MQKIWRQIGFNAEDWNFLLGFMEDEHSRNETQAISQMISQIRNYRKIIAHLESEIFKHEQKIKERKHKKEVVKDE